MAKEKPELMRLPRPRMTQLKSKLLMLKLLPKRRLRTIKMLRKLPITRSKTHGLDLSTKLMEPDSREVPTKSLAE